jgi:nitrite reductase/ring-hydroxylating ferredoxin subunit
MPEGGEWIALCALDQIPEPGARGIRRGADGVDALFVVRAMGVLRAYRNDCPHWPGSPMAWRQDGYLDAAAEQIVCHAHGARFDIADGHCVAGPCPGKALTAVPLRVDAARTVWVYWRL